MSIFESLRNRTQTASTREEPPAASLSADSTDRDAAAAPHKSSEGPDASPAPGSALRIKVEPESGLGIP